MGSFAPDISPQNLRESIIFSPFLLHLPQLLDKSIPIAKSFMQLILNLLIFCPANERPDVSNIPIYSISLLHPTLQSSWLESVLILLYKYDMNSQADNTSLMQILHICLSILRNSNHECEETRQENELVFRNRNIEDNRQSEPKLSKLKVLRKYVNREDQKAREKSIVLMSIPKKSDLSTSWFVKFVI